MYHLIFNTCQNQIFRSMRLKTLLFIVSVLLMQSLPAQSEVENFLYVNLQDSLSSSGIVIENQCSFYRYGNTITFAGDNSWSATTIDEESSEIILNIISSIDSNYAKPGFWQPGYRVLSAGCITALCKGPVKSSLYVVDFSMAEQDQNTREAYIITTRNDTVKSIFLAAMDVIGQLNMTSSTTFESGFDSSFTTEVIMNFPDYGDDTVISNYRAYIDKDGFVVRFRP